MSDRGSVDVPSGVAGIAGAREANDEQAKVRSALPPFAIEELVDGFQETWRVRRLVERLAVDHPTDDRLWPRSRSGYLELLHGEAAALLCNHARDRLLDAQVTLLDEPLDLRATEHRPMLVHPGRGPERSSRLFLAS